jgi:hypothetical protein
MPFEERRGGKEWARRINFYMPTESARHGLSQSSGGGCRLLEHQSVVYGLVELKCWDAENEHIVDRQERPWHNPNRRPSHSDRRRKIALEMLRDRFMTTLPAAQLSPKTIALLDELLCPAA